MRADNTRWHAIGAALAVFAIGLAGGWCVKPLLIGHQPSEDTVLAGSAAEARATPLGGKTGQAPSEHADKFMSRLHDAISIRSRSKRERSLSAIAENLEAAEIRDALMDLDKMRIPQRDQVRALLLARWGELDPAAAIAYALGLPRAAQSRDAVNAVVNGWVEKDANAAAEWIAELPDGVLKNAALETLIKAVATTEPRHAFALLRSAPSSLNAQGMSGNLTGIIHAVFAKWAENEPREAAAAAAQLGDPLREPALYMVAASWANTDIGSALAWAQSQPNDLAKQRLGESSLAMNAVTGVMETWMNKDPEAAMTWLEELRDGNEKANLVQSALLLTYQQDPPRAMELALMIPEGTAQESALRFAVRSWAATDPAGAFTWATGQPDERVRRTTLKVVASQWLNADPDGASQWIAGLPASPAKDGMLSDAVRLILEGETVGRSGYRPSIDRMPGDGYRALAQVIANIGDPQSREAALEKLATLWLRKNSDVARAWLDSAALPANVKERLLKSGATPQCNP